MFANQLRLQFSAFDEDNDLLPTVNCAKGWKGGWWYAKCTITNLNGDYNNTVKGVFGAGLGSTRH